MTTVNELEFPLGGAYEIEVGRGIIWLDNVMPDWRERINLETLEEGSDLDVLGQLFGPPEVYMHLPYLPRPLVEYGFAYADDREGWQTQATNVWKATIQRIGRYVQPVFPSPKSIGKHAGWIEHFNRLWMYIPIPSEHSGLKAIGVWSAGAISRISVASYAPVAAQKICAELNALAEKELTQEQAEVELQKIGVQLLAGRRVPGVGKNRL